MNGLTVNDGQREEPESHGSESHLAESLRELMAPVALELLKQISSGHYQHPGDDRTNHHPDRQHNQCAR